MKKYHSVVSKKTVTWIMVGAIIILLYVALLNLSDIAAFCKKTLGIFSPFSTGIVLAYIMNLLMVPIEKYMFSWIKRPKLRRILSALLCMMFFIGIVVTLVNAIIPQISESITLLVGNIQNYINGTGILTEFVESREQLSEIVSTFIGSWKDIFRSISDWAKSLLPSLINLSIQFGTGIVDLLISIITAVYILIDREHVLHTAAVVCRAFTKDVTYRRIRSVVAHGSEIFSRYVGGTLIDSFILGMSCYVGMLIMKIPYAVLVSIIVGCTNIIPSFGSYLGALLSTLIILIDTPIKALYFLIFIMILNTIEANLLIPLIIGDVTGLSPLWVLVSIVLFGSIWGFAGMALGVPLFAVLYYIAGEWVRKKVSEKDKIKSAEEASAGD